MNASHIYIAVSIAVLFIIVLLVFVRCRNKKVKRLTPLTVLACVFVLAGILFGHDRLIGYGLMGVGVILAVINILRELKSS